MIEFLGQRASDSNNSLPQQCLILFIIPPPLIGGDIKRCFCLTSVCLSVAYIGPKSRTERPRKTIIGTEVAHVTRDSETTFRVERSRSPGRFTHRSLNVRGRCSGDRENVLGVRNYCYRATLRLLGGAQGAWAPRGRRGAGAYRVATRTACYKQNASIDVRQWPMQAFRVILSCLRRHIPLWN